MLSVRAFNSLEYKCKLKERLDKARINIFHPDLNVQGMVDFGTAENKICEDLMIQKLKDGYMETFSPSSTYYYESHGKQRFREALAVYFTNQLHLKLTIDPENLIVVNGVSGALNILGHVLTDAGDWVLLPTPVYGCLRHTLKAVSDVNCYRVPFYQRERSCLANMDSLETHYQKATKEGKRINGLLLTHPNNPTGYTMLEEEMRDVLKFCKRHNIHLIVDEIYALCCYGEKTFTSFLQINDTKDTSIHVLWGFSKDFGIAGYRCGTLHTYNQVVLDYCKTNAKFWSVASPVQDSLTKLISDSDWCENTYFRTFWDELKKRHKFLCEKLRMYRIDVWPGSHGIFIMANFSKYLSSSNFEGEDAFLKTLMENKILFHPGQEFLFSEPGWMRIVFTNYRSHFDIGIQRMEDLLKTACRKVQGWKTEAKMAAGGR